MKLAGEVIKQNGSKDEDSPLALYRCIGYAVPCVATMFLFTPITLLQGIYAKYYGLTLGSIAAVILVTRLFDVISDPLIGYWSDRYQARTGSRQPFLVAGGILLALASYFLYSPPAQVTVVYFGAWLILFYLGFTLFEIPHLALGGELAKHSKDKAALYSVRSAAAYVGLILFYIIPFLPFFDSSAITPETLRLCGMIGPVLILLTFLLYFKTAPSADARPEMTRDLKEITDKHDQNPKIRKQELVLLLRVFQRNRPFLILAGAMLPYGLGLGMWYSLIFIYVDGYLGLGEQFASMYLVAMIVGLISTPLWYKVAATYGNKTAFAVAVILTLASFTYTGMLKPGEAGLVELIALKVLNILGAAGAGIAMYSLLSEVADYGTWKFGVNRSASYFSVYVFFGKFNMAIGGTLSLGIAGWYGFDPSLPIQAEAAATTGLILATAWLPAGLVLVSLAFVAGISLNSHRHDIIRRRLAARELRLKKGREFFEQSSCPKTC